MDEEEEEFSHILANGKWLNSTISIVSFILRKIHQNQKILSENCQEAHAENSLHTTIYQKDVTSRKSCNQLFPSGLDQVFVHSFGATCHFAIVSGKFYNQKQNKETKEGE